MRRALILLGALAWLALPLLGPHGPHAVAEVESYLQTFDGAPESPRPYRPPGWDVTVHSRDPGHWHSLDPMEAQHGADCGPPPASHALTGAYAEAVFLCRDHLMTSINAGAYGVIYLVPDRLLDFSTGEAVLRFDLSTLRTSTRDWVDLWVSPFEDHLQLPLDRWLPDLDGEPRNALHLRMDNTGPGSMFRTGLIRDFTPIAVPGKTWIGYERFLEPSATRRDTFELRLSRTHVKFGMPTYNFWWVDAEIADLGWDRGVVQLGHHSYNPTKAVYPDGSHGTPNTWHWDNVALEPAAPFTIIPANQSFVDQSTPPDVTFPAPAPEQAFLRFAAIGNDLKVSFDDGATWATPRLQPAATPHADHAQSYWTPVPTGTGAIKFAAKGGYWGRQWTIHDISIWSLLPASAPPPDADPT